MSFLGITLGEIVCSKAGRDTGRYFVVVKQVDDIYLLISDGDLRKIEKPKKKKLKHLDFTGVTIDSLKDKLMDGQKVKNAEIRKMLAHYLNSSVCNDEESSKSDK